MGSATQVAWSRDSAVDAREHAPQSSWIPHGDCIGKGPVQPPQLACTGRLRAGRLESGQSSRRRGNTLAELLIPRRRIGKGPGQPPQLASTGRLRGSATQVAWNRRDSAVDAQGTQARRAVRTLVSPFPARAPGQHAMQGRQHKTACGNMCDSGRKESAGQSSRCTGTQAQGWRTLVAPLRKLQGTHAGSPSTATALATCGRGRKESGQSSRCAGTQAQGWRTLVGPFAGAPGHPCRVAKAVRPRHLVVHASRCRESARK